MSLIKDRNGMDLTEAEDIRRGGKDTQKNCTKKDLHDPDNHDDVITHLEPDILKHCKSTILQQNIYTEKSILMRTQICPFPTQEAHTCPTRGIGWSWFGSTTQSVPAEEGL